MSPTEPDHDEPDHDEPDHDEPDPTRPDPDLLVAFWDYERALRTNDVPALERWFAPGPETLRADGGAALVGAEHIAGFRRGRRPPGPRQVDRLHVRRLGPDVALVVAETTRPDGTLGAQSQVWARTADGWRVTAAHVGTSPAPRPAEVDPTGVWRLAGPPAPDPGEPRAGGPGPAPLAGVRLAVKDLFAVRGQRVGAGSPRWLAEAPVEDVTAPAVAALLAAGATVAGLAHTDELAFSLAGVSAGYGAVPNPAAPGRISGGSSSGPAAAVAAGLADLGLGTDTAGSIRVPASYCGLYGLRPTHGAIDLTGAVPLAPSFDTVGLLARDPGLLATAAGLLLPAAEPPPGPGATAPPGPVTTLLRPDDVLAELDADLRTAFDAAALALAGRTGCRVVAAPDLAETITGWLPAFRAVQAAEAWRAHGGFVERARDALDPAVVARFEFGRTVTPADEAAAREVLAGARRTLTGLLAPGVALLLPASSSPALPVDLPADRVDVARGATLRLTCLASLAGLPAVAVPALRVGGLPMALSVVGAPGADRALLELITRRPPWEAP